MRSAKIVLLAVWEGWCSSCATARPLVLTRTGRLGVRSWLTMDPVESRPLTLTCRLCGTWTSVPAEKDDPPVELSVDDAQAPHRATAAAAPSPAGAAGIPSPIAPPTGAPMPTAPPVAAPLLTAARLFTRAVTAAAPAALTAPGAASGTLPPSVSPVPASSPPPSTIAATPDQAAPAGSATGLDPARAALGDALRAHLARRSGSAPLASQSPALAPLPTTADRPAVATLPSASARPTVAPPPTVASLPTAACTTALPLQRSAPSADSLATLELLADGFDLLGSGRP